MMHTTDELVDFVDSVTRRSAMYVRASSEHFNCVAAFLTGYDAALNGSLLEGLVEWLCMTHDKSYNVTWDTIIAIEALGESEFRNTPWGEASEEALLSALRETLTRFFMHRGQVGVRNVLYDHGVWMRSKSWFDENVERYGSSAGPQDGPSPI